MPYINRPPGSSTPGTAGSGAGTITGQAATQGVGAPFTVTLGNGFTPGHAVLYTGGADEGARVSTTGGTVTLTPATVATYKARLYSASSGGLCLWETPAFVVGAGLPSLAALTLSAATFTAGAAAGTVIGNIVGTTAGSTITVTPNDGRLAVSADGSQLLVGLTASGAGSIAATLVETLAGYGNSPRSSAATITVASASRTSNIASNCRVPGWQTASLSNGTNTTSNLRLSHFNESGAAVTSVKPIYSGWYTNTVSVANNANPITITAAIEYPAGTMTQVTFNGGSTSVSLTPGVNLVADACNVSIPNGAEFWSRTFVSVLAGQVPAHVWPLCTGSLVSQGAVGTCDLGVGLTDKTMSGTITGTNAGYGPSAIIATSTGFSKVSAMGCGDSLMAGASDGNYSTRRNTGIMGRSVDSQCPWVLCAVTGTKALDQVGAWSQRVDLMTKAGITHVITNYAINDISAGTSVAALQAALQSNWAAIAATGAKIIEVTTPPRTTSTDNWLSAAGQTAYATNGGFAGGAASRRALLNAWLRTKPSFTGGAVYDFLEFADSVETARDSGILLAGAGAHTTGYVLSGTDAGGSTTTVIQTGLALTASRYNFGKLVFTSGVNAGSIKTISSHTTGGALTISAAFTTAPTAGDAFYIFALTDQNTTDGLHPAVTGTGGSGFGGVYYAVDALRPKLATLVASG